MDDFYKVIGPSDAILSTTGPFPFTTEFRLRYSGRFIGKAVDSYEDGELITKYFLPEKGEKEG